MSQHRTKPHTHHACETPFMYERAHKTTRHTRRSRPLSSSQPTNHPPQTHTTRVYVCGGFGQVERVTAAIAKRETPGPIPNPEVKPFSADGTATERLWESRTPPDIHCGSGVTFGWPHFCISGPFGDGAHAGFVGHESSTGSSRCTLSTGRCRWHASVSVPAARVVAGGAL